MYIYEGNIRIDTINHKLSQWDIFPSYFFKWWDYFCSLQFANMFQVIEKGKEMNGLTS